MEPPDPAELPWDGTSTAVQGYLPARAALVGRVNELAFLRGQYLAVAAGRGGRLLFLSGEPGVGKTRLAQEVGLYAQGHGGVLLEGSYLREGTTPHSAWVDSLRPGLRDLHSDELASLVGPYGPDLSQLFPELTERLGPFPMLSALPPEEQRRRLLDGLAQLVIGISKRSPLVLVLNDLQWAPELAPLVHLARRLPESRTLVLGTYRQQEFQERPALMQEWAELNRARLVTQLVLRPLAEDETAQLIAQYFGEGPAEQLRAPLYRQTRGNPFFLEEVLRSLAETGAVRAGSAGWEVVDLARLTVPASIKLVIEERVARLGPSALEILTHAAVLGLEFSFPALQAVTGRSEDELLDVIAQAVAARLLVDRSVVGEERYAFADDQVQEVLYESIPAPRRRRDHLRAGQVLETLYAGRPDGGVEELAYHFRAANDRAKALEYALKAGERAYALSVWGQAVRHFQTASELFTGSPEDLPRQAWVLERLADLDVLQGHQGLQHIQGALELYTRLGDKRKAALLHRLLGARWATGAAGRVDGQRAMHHLEAAVRELETEPDSPEKVSCYGGLTMGYFLIALDVDRAVEYGRQGLAVAERVNNSDQMAYACTYLATALAYRGELGRAEDYAERSWEAALQGNAPWARTNSAVYPLIVWPWTHHRAWVERWLERYLDCSRRLHVKLFDRPATGCAALVAALLGKPQEAAEALQRAEEVGAQHGSHHPFVNFSYFAAAAYEILGNWEQADRLFGRALETSESGRVTATAAEGAFFCGRFLLASGDAAGARAVLTKGYALARDRGSVVQELHLLPLLCELDVQAGQLDQAGRSLERARELLTRPVAGCSRSPDWRGLTAPIHRAEGVLAAARARWPEAEQAFGRAREVERSYGFPYDEARVLVPWAEMYLKRDARGDRERALGLLEQALAIFHRCAAAKDVEGLLARRELLTAQEPARPAPGVAREPAARGHSPLLTPRELEVVPLVAQGLTNRQIAEKLVITEGTARIHVEHILGKLGLHSRAQLAAWAVEHGFGAARSD